MWAGREGCSLGVSTIPCTNSGGGTFSATGARDDHHCPLLPTNLWPKYGPDVEQSQLFAVKPELSSQLLLPEHSHRSPGLIWISVPWS